MKPFGPALMVVLMTLVGCAASQQLTPATPRTDTAVLDAPFDKVWQATVATLAEEGMPIQTIEKESGIVTTQFVSFASGYSAEREIDQLAKRPRTFLGLGTWNSGRYTLSIYVSRVDSATTRIKATPHIEGFENNVSKSWVMCESNGALEEKMFAGIRSKL